MLSSLTIECIQLGLTFRSFDIDDILLNSFGVYIGFLIYKWITLIFMNKQSHKRYIKSFNPTSDNGNYVNTKPL
ncbi:VanZ family protein [Bacillus toyonensis]